MTNRFFAFWLVGCMAACSAVHARNLENGLTEKTILVGRITPRSSPTFAAMAKQRTAAADAYIAAVNAGGGVHGRRIIIKDRDDAYDPVVAARETQALIQKDEVFAMLGAFGSPTLPVVMNLVEAAGVPLIGAVTLSEEAREPVRRFVFPVRAGALKETHTAIDHQLTLGMRRFVVLNSREAYGREGAQAYRRSLANHKVEPVAVVEFAATDSPAEVAKKIHAARPQVLLVSVLPKPFANVFKEYRQLGGGAHVYGFSAIRIEDMDNALGPLSTGIVLSEAVPVPTRLSVPLVKEYQMALQQYGSGALPSYHGLDAYIEARVLVEGLRRAGPDLSRAKLVSALEQIRGHDFGGVVVRYGPNDRTGSTFVEVVMLQAGKIVY